MKLISGRPVYSVSEVNSFARDSLEKMSFWVEGEVSSFKGLNTHYRYLYFDLKDSQTKYKLPCILEPEIYNALNFKVTDGQKIIALGNLTLWEKDGRYQMYVHQIEEFGEGILLAQLEMLKKKLEKRGYFKMEFKKTLPAYPTNIAVISSSVSDAWQDFKKHSIDLFPLIKITFFDVVVQGEKSAQQIISALKKADQMSFDTIVLVRGGGSIEDLSPYNDEAVAEAIFKAKTPIVVGVGHEKDVTIAQLVADIAASTPTDAAKIITANFVTLTHQLRFYLDQMSKSITIFFSLNFQNLDLLLNKLIFHKQSYQEISTRFAFLEQSLSGARRKIFDHSQNALQSLFASLKRSWGLNFHNASERHKQITDKLYLLSPKNTLSRGYSIATDSQNRILRDIKSVAIGSKIKVRLSKGLLLSKVLEKQARQVL